MPARLSTLAALVFGTLYAYASSSGSDSTYTSATSSPLPAGFAPLRVGFDPIYDAPATPMTAVACSDGARGLIPLGFPTFASLPSFPFVGAVSAVAAWNSSACATCWELRYECVGQAKEWPKEKAETEGGEGEGTAMNELTCGHGVQLGVVQAAYRQVNTAMCGL
ncbi:Cerato-platanin-domain-containing protein [Schizophyllum commune]